MTRVGKDVGIRGSWTLPARMQTGSLLGERQCPAEQNVHAPTLQLLRLGRSETYTRMLLECTKVTKSETS